MSLARTLRVQMFRYIPLATDAIMATVAAMEKASLTMAWEVEVRKIEDEDCWVSLHNGPPVVYLYKRGRCLNATPRTMGLHSAWRRVMDTFSPKSSRNNVTIVARPHSFIVLEPTLCKSDYATIRPSLDLCLYLQCPAKEMRANILGHKLKLVHACCACMHP
jgi:hypothetical protein